MTVHSNLEGVCNFTSCSWPLIPISQSHCIDIIMIFLKHFCIGWIPNKIFTFHFDTVWERWVSPPIKWWEKLRVWHFNIILFVDMLCMFYFNIHVRLNHNGHFRSSSTCNWLRMIHFNQRRFPSKKKLNLLSLDLLCVTNQTYRKVRGSFDIGIWITKSDKCSPYNYQHSDDKA